MKKKLALISKMPFVIISEHAKGIFYYSRSGSTHEIKFFDSKSFLTVKELYTIHITKALKYKVESTEYTDST